MSAIGKAVIASAVGVVMDSCAAGRGTKTVTYRGYPLHYSYLTDTDW
jgi:hypothetical protein